MVAEQLKQHFLSASSRWPAIKWSKSSYERHLNIVAKLDTRHPEDLYLSGAAGFRAQEAWSSVYDEYMSLVIHTLRKMSIPGCEPSDVWASVIEKLLQPSETYPTESMLSCEDCQFPPSRLAEFEGRASLKNYFVFIAANKARDLLRTSESRLRRAGRVTVLQESTVQAISFGQGYGPQDEKQAVVVELKAGIDKLDKMEQHVLRATVLLGLSNKKTADLLGISESKATRTRQSAVEKLKEILRQRADFAADHDGSGFDEVSHFFRRTLQSLAD